MSQGRIEHTGMINRKFMEFFLYHELRFNPDIFPHREIRTIGWGCIITRTIWRFNKELTKETVYKRKSLNSILLVPAATRENISTKKEFLLKKRNHLRHLYDRRLPLHLPPPPHKLWSNCKQQKKNGNVQNQFEKPTNGKIMSQKKYYPLTQKRSCEQNNRLK